MNVSDIVVDPHRRTLNLTRVAAIRGTMRQVGLPVDGLGAAVAYRPSVGWVLLAGEHRFAAASAPGGKVRMLVLNSWEDFLAWMAVDMLDDRRTPFNPVSAVAMYEKVILALKPQRGDKALPVFSEYVGLNRGALENVRFANSFVADLDNPADEREYMAGQIRVVESGAETGHSLRDQLLRFQEKKAAKTRPTLSAAAQRKSLESIGQLEGIIHALHDLGPINRDLTAEEREQAARRLGALGPLMAKIKKNLRGEL